jgi:CubicO group peptidase (beta-lactamase class C family)
MPAPVIDGHISSGFESVGEMFTRLWDDIEIGAALTVFRDNERIIDLHGGFTDRNCTKPWTEDTLVNVYSTSKGITAMALACLVEDGLLDYSAPVAEYWPEFGAERKFDLTVTQALSHQAGLYTFNPAIETADLYNWQSATFNIASQVPSWTPGKGFGYHAITWGFIAGELIQRVTGESPGSYIRRRIAEPLSADVHLGLSASEHHRCADLVGPNHARKVMPESKQHPVTFERLRSNDPPLTPYKDVCSPDWRKAELPSSNMHATARGLAECYRGMLDGTLVSGSTLRLATEEITDGEVDLCFGRPVRRSRGFILNCDDCYAGPETAAFGHSGTGGSVAFADPVNNISFAYVMNQMDRDGRARANQLVASLFECL